jgi:N-acetylmuramoyl-L-alanine amidase
VHRLIAGFIAFLAMTATMLVLPVYAAPGPDAKPVAAQTEVVELGSLEEPAPAADVQQGLTDPVAGVPQTLPTLTVTETDVEPFSLIGVTWRYDLAVTDTIVQVRVQDVAGAWGDWTEVAIEEAEQNPGADSGAELRGGTEPLWTGPSSGVEAELVTRSGAQPTDVKLTLIDPGSSPADGATESPEITDTAEAAGSMPPVYSRAQWGADESLRAGRPEYASTIKAAIVHHTAGANGYAAAQVPGILRGVYTYHAVSRGWGDIGYNVLVDRFGRLWEGRYGGLASTVIGAHAGGFNTNTFGVSMIGNYDTTPTTPAMVAAAAEIIAWKFSLYQVNPRGTTTLVSGGGDTSRTSSGTRVTLPTIFGHRDVGSTTCPGAYGYAQLPTIRNLVAQRLPAYSSPQGNLDGVVGGLGSVTLSGWVFDPDVPAESISVHVYVDGRPLAALSANRMRADIGAAYPWAGSRHGFSATLTLTPGKHTVCTYGINRSYGSNKLLGCRAVTVRAPDPVPKGSLDAVTVFGSRFSVSGWGFDEDEPSRAISVHVYVDGRIVGRAIADDTRNDVGRAYPGVGSQHGFSAAFPVSDGAHRVCAYAINLGAGRNAALGCRAVSVGPASHNPVGELTSASVVKRSVTLGGWSVDPNAPTSPTSVHLYVDGQGVAATVAGAVTSAMSRYAVFGVDSRHGFTYTLPLRAGIHRICAYGINVGAGGSTLLGCRSVTVEASAWNPEGAFDGVSVDERTVTVSGWALDFDRPTAPINVHLYVDGRPVVSVPANGRRPEVARAFPGTGENHGYQRTLTLPAGEHTVCGYAINVGQGTANPRLGCREVTIMASAYNPEGTVDAVVPISGGVQIHGWAYDPDVVAQPVRVHVYVDGVGRAAITADGFRPDVGAAFPGVGNNHGYQTMITVLPGTHTVCAYAINVETGTRNTGLGCREVTV